MISEPNTKRPPYSFSRTVTFTLVALLPALISGGAIYHLRTVRALERQRNNLYFASLYNHVQIGNHLHEGKAAWLQTNSDSLVQALSTELANNLRHSPAFPAAARTLLDYGEKWQVPIPFELKAALQSVPPMTPYQAFEPPLDWPPR